MSHFTVLVFAPEETTREGAEDAIRHLLAPWNENLQVPEYREDCDCLGDVAKKRVRKLTEEKFGDERDVRAFFNEAHPYPPDTEYGSEEWKAWEKTTSKAWQDTIAPRLAFEEEMLAAQPDKDSPDPACGFYTEDYCPEGRAKGERYEDGSGCGGTGKVLSTQNPLSKWDWWTIGGRWRGAMAGELFTPNYARLDAGIHDADAMPVKMIPAQFRPFAFITPEGEWCQKARMGWFACAFGAKPDEEWQAEWEAAKSQYTDCVGVLVDCHI